MISKYFEIKDIGSGRNVLINVNHIIAMEESSWGTSIKMTGKLIFQVSEPMSRIKGTLSNMGYLLYKCATPENEEEDKLL